MTPKQKAEKLWWDYYSAIEHTLSEEYSPHESAIAKQCALIAVDEMLNNAGFIWGGGTTGESARDEYRKYWNEVKKELEDL